MCTYRAHTSADTHPVFSLPAFVDCQKIYVSLRPIAICLTLRRLIARAACEKVREKAVELLNSTQIKIVIR